MHNENKAWVVAVDMGYGHQRAAYPLKDIAYQRIITANSDKIISPEEKRMWDRLRHFYELVSRLKDKPYGKFFFHLYDRFQSISPFFPFRDLSMPNMGAKHFKRIILRKGQCKSLVDYLRQEKIPLVTTHFIPALAAHYYGMNGIYCVVTDTDINRAWVPVDAKNSNITYFASCEHVARRLKEYGVKEDNILLTGFPLPKENIGGRDKSTIKRDLGRRIPNLDLKKKYTQRFQKTLEDHLGEFLVEQSDHPLTITYVVGGAGVARDIGIKIVQSLENRISEQKLCINLVAGTRLDIKSYFEDNLRHLGLDKIIGHGINIIFAFDKPSYFSLFNEALHTTDILWTKPSELSFYTALGLPIIIAPPVGAHERYNQRWLEDMGSGFVQENPEYVNDWLFYWLEDGRLAEAAFEGFLEAPNLGSYNIEDAISGYFLSTHCQLSAQE